MRKIGIAFGIALGLSLNITAQDAAMSNKLGLGFHLSQYQRDFGLGLNISSPYIANNTLAVRLRGNMMFNEHVKKGITTWSPYANSSLGLLVAAGKIGESIRLYGEGGVIVLLPSTEFSSSDYELGGYGVFGFEFYMDPQRNYFIEIGGVGTGAVADKVWTQPIYSNGLIINTGFRMHF